MLFTDKIIKATISDLPLIMETFMACTAEMKKHGIDQWNYQYPFPTEVLKDIQKGTVFIFKNHKRVIGTITLNRDQDIQYRNINWNYKAENIMVMHRLAVHPASQGLGFSKKLCAFAEKYTLDNGCEVIRLDAYSENPVSNNLYLSQGYSIAPGVCYYHGVKRPFYCYEKKLKNF